MSEHVDLRRLRDDLARADLRGDERGFVAAARDLLGSLGSRQPTQLDLVVCDRLLTLMEHAKLHEDALHLCTEAARLCDAMHDRHGAAHFRLRGALWCVLVVDLDAAQGVLEAELGVLLDPPPSPQRLAAALCALPPASDGEDEERLRNQARVALAYLFAARGRFVAAENLLVDLSRWLERVEDPALSREEVLLLLAEVRLDQGDLAGFDAVRAKAGKTTTSVRWDLLASMRLRWVGRYSEAVRGFASVIERARDAHLQDVLVEAQWQQLDVLAALNRLDESETILASIEMSSGDEARAEQMHRLLTARDLEADGPGSAKGTLYPTPLSDAPPAPAGVAAVLGERRSVRLRVDVAHATNELLLELHAGRLDEAVLRLSALEGLIHHSESALLQARLASMRMLVDYYRGDYARALDHCNAARVAYERLGMQPDAWACSCLRTWALRRNAAPDAQIEASRKDAQRRLDQMQSMLEPHDRVFHSLNKWSRADERLSSVMRTLHEQWPDQRPSGFLTEQRRVRLLRAAEAAISRSIGWSHINPAAGDQDQGTGIYADVRAHLGLGRTARSGSIPHPFWLPANVAIVRYIVLPDRLEGFAIWRGGSMLLECNQPRPRARVRQDVARLIRYCEGPEPWDGQHSVVQSVSAMLGVGQLAEALPRRVRRLMILTDDALHQVPFSALTVDGQPFVTRFTPTLLTAFSWTPTARPPCADDTKVVGVGVEASECEAQLPPLQQVDAELHTIAQTVGSLRTYRNSAATRPMIKDILQREDNIHFACHGDFDIEHPLRSGILLHDGWLTVADVGRLRTQASLIVLSACWGANVRILPGREVMGLPFTLLSTGSQCVISSLWTVFDVTSPEFMGDLYTHMADTGPAEALARVQRDWADRNTPVSDWSCYVAFGRGVQARAPLCWFHRLRDLVRASLGPPRRS